MSWLRLHGDSSDQSSKMQLEEACTPIRPADGAMTRPPTAHAAPTQQEAFHVPEKEIIDEMRSNHEDADQRDGVHASHP